MVKGDREKGSKGAGREELAIGEVQHPGDAILQIQPECDEAVHPAKDDAVQHDFEHLSAKPPDADGRMWVRPP